jgi:hypothetical protein
MAKWSWWSMHHFQFVITRLIRATLDANRHSSGNNAPPFKAASNPPSENARETTDNKKNNLSSTNMNGYDNNEGYVDGDTSK